VTLKDDDNDKAQEVMHKKTLGEALDQYSNGTLVQTSSQLGPLKRYTRRHRLIMAFSPSDAAYAARTSGRLLWPKRARADVFFPLEPDE
jgi:hypothetical protein